MTRQIVKKPRAERDLIEHCSYIARDKIAPAERFLRVAEESFARIAEMPGIGRRWESSQPHLTGIRVYPMPSGFRNYLIFYRLSGRDIEILCVLHGARDLGPLLDSLFLDDPSR
jgi:plasmid stabilization system protein ParE